MAGATDGWGTVAGEKGGRMAHTEYSMRMERWVADLRAALEVEKGLRREAEAERDQWQESCGQNYVRAQEAEAREERLREAIERHESGQRKYGTGISYLDQELWAVLKATNGR